MDFFNRALAQLSDLFRSMTPGARITTGLLLAVVVVSFGYLFQQGTAGPDQYLFGGEYLPDSQLNAVEAAIAKAGLSGYERSGNRIRVPSGEKAAYLAAVANEGALPRNFHTLLENALDSAGPWESREATQQRMKIAKQQTLSEIVRAMDWVDEAVVLYDEQKRRGLGPKEVTASINVKPIVGEMLDPRRARMLKDLVAHAVVGMVAENVNVTNLGEGGAYGDDGGFYPEAFDDEYYQNKVAYEQYRRQSILSALRFIPGVRVEVNAELDSMIEETVRDIQPEAQTATLSELTKTETESQSTPNGGGRPGVFAQGPNQPAGAELASQQSQKERQSDTTETQNVVGETDTITRRTGMVPTKVWATVAVPQDYVVSIWKQRNPEATAEPSNSDVKILGDNIVLKIQNIVEPLLTGPSKGEDSFKQVKVEIVESIAVPSLEPPSMGSKAMAWTGRYWSTLAMLGVAMFSLLVLRSVVKGLPLGDESAAADVVEPAASVALHVAEEETEAEPDENGRQKLKLKKGSSLKDDLADIVREDPDAAAAILKSWIGKAS